MPSRKRVERSKAEAPPLYDVEELSLEEVTLLRAAEREEQSLRELQPERKQARKTPQPAD